MWKIFWPTTMSDSGQLMESYAGNLWCVALSLRWLTLPSLMVGSVQSKEKFLSAVSSDGFGFCSVILYVISQIYYRAFTRGPVAGTCTMPCIQGSSSSPTREMAIVTLSHLSICPHTAGSFGRKTFHSFWFLSWIPKRRPPSASAHAGY